MWPKIKKKSNNSAISHRKQYLFLPSKHRSMYTYCRSGTKFVGSVTQNYTLNKVYLFIFNIQTILQIKKLLNKLNKLNSGKMIK